MQSLLKHLKSVHVVNHRATTRDLSEMKQVLIDSSPHDFINTQYVEKGLIAPTILIGTFEGTAIELIKLFENSLNEPFALKWCLEDVSISTTSTTTETNDSSMALIDHDDENDSDDVKILKLVLRKRLENVGSTTVHTFYLLIQLYGNIAIPLTSLQQSVFVIDENNNDDENEESSGHHHQPWLQSKL
jgi:hypothetical protein